MQLENSCAVNATERRYLKIQSNGIVSANHSMKVDVPRPHLHSHQLTWRAKYSSAISTSYFTELHLLEANSMREAAWSAFMPCLIRWSYRCQKKKTYHTLEVLCNQHTLPSTRLEYYRKCRQKFQFLTTMPAQQSPHVVSMEEQETDILTINIIKHRNNDEAVPWSMWHRMGFEDEKTSATCVKYHIHSFLVCL